MRFLNLIFVLTTLSCSMSNDEVVSKLDSFNKQAEQNLKQQRAEFSRLAEQSYYGESESALEIDTIFAMLDSLTAAIDGATSSNELSELITIWNRSFGTELDLAKSNDLQLQKRITSLDIRLSAKVLIDEIMIGVSGGPIKFNMIEFYVAAEDKEIRLGESTEVKLTLVAVPGNLDAVFDILLNGDTVKTKEGQGIYQFSPTRRGTFELQGSIQGKPGIKRLEGWKMEDKLKIVVK